MDRRLTVADDQGFDLLDALLDDPFAICSIVVDVEGRPVDYRFLRVSPCFGEMTGFENVEGRTIREIAPRVEAKWIELYGRVALDRTPARFREGSEVTGREYEVHAAPLDPPGHFVMTFRDVTALHQIEQEREAALEHAQHLLKELGHRVMNSFAAIASIIAMEARAAPEGGRAPLSRVQGRIQALAALYRRLDGASQVDEIDAADYLGGVVAGFRDSMAAPAGVTVDADLAPVALPTRRAVPLALVLNELLTNAVKHAFGGTGRGRISIALSTEGRTCSLRIADDGTGMSPAAPGSGVGRSLVAAFVGELDGELATATGPNGTVVTVTFPI
jgi:two-component sensor histidine kinase